MPAADAPTVAARLARVRAELAGAAGGRPVTLVAASKRQPVAALQQLYALGVWDFGENYPQELLAKARAWQPAPTALRWHLLGGLQRNKVQAVGRLLDVLHSLDSVPLAEALSAVRLAAPARPPLEVFVQVDVPPSCLGRADSPRPPARAAPSAGARRRGVPPAEVAALAAAVQRLPGLVLRGLMVLPRPGEAEFAFASVAALARRLVASGHLPAGCALSMGMSDDFGAAVAHGATLVRLGTALFGPRPTSAKGR